MFQVLDITKRKKLMPKFALSFLLASILAVIGFASFGTILHAADPLTGWSYVREVELSPTGNSHTDYQVRIDFDGTHSSVFTNANEDASDLRCTDSSNVLLDMWVETWSTSTETGEVWCEVGTISDSATTTIHIHYGNAGAASVSNCEDTFLFCDDFSTIVQGDTIFDTELTIGNIDTTNHPTNPIIIDELPTWQNGQVREASNAWCDDDYCYVYITGVSSADNSRSSGLFTTTIADIDHASGWPGYANNPVLTGCEDAFITMEATTTSGELWQDSSSDYWIFCERYSGATEEGDINAFSCSTLVSCTAEGVVLSPSADSSGDNDWVGSPTVVHYQGVLYMLYEGSQDPSTDADDIYYATATVADPTSWSKWTNSGNEAEPILDADNAGQWGQDGLVPDSLTYDGSSRWVMIGHAQPPTEGQFSSGRWHTQDAPSDWDDSSFTELGVNPFDGSSQVQYIHNSPGPEFITWSEGLGDDFYLADAITTDKWTPFRRATRTSPITDSLQQISATHAQISTFSGDAVNNPENGGGEDANHSVGFIASSTFSGTDNIRLRARQRIQNETGSAGYITLGFGNNGMASTTSSNGEWEFLMEDAYAGQWQRGASNNTFLAEKVSGTWNGTSGTFTLANMQADNEHLLTFCTAGCASDLVYSVEGIGTIASRATETTLVNMPKKVFFGSGSHDSLNRGGDQVVDFILVQKFEDDDEYSPTIGAEQEGGGGTRLIIIFWWW